MSQSLLARLLPRYRDHSRKPSTRVRSRRLGIEALEGRDLLSATPVTTTPPGRAVSAVQSTMAAVYSQAPSSAGGVMKSAWYPPDGLDGDQYVFDSFTLGSAQAIKEIRWRGGYTNFQSGAGESPVYDFTISIYPSIAAAIQPDVTAQPLAQYSVGGNGGETAAGTVGAIPMYDYHYVLPTPFHAAAGTKYWVQIEASQGLTPTYSWPPDWGIAVGTGGDGGDFRAITGGTYAGGTLYATYSGDAAFTLLALTSNQATPKITVGGGPFAYDGKFHAATATALATNGVTRVRGSFAFGYFQNGVAVQPINAGTYDVVATFTSSDPKYASTAAAGHITINKITPVFSYLGSPTIIAGAASATVTGRLASGTLVPAGALVGVTLNKTVQVASVGANGRFSASFSTAGLAGGRYSILCTFSGNTNFRAAASAKCTLTVQSAPVVIVNPTSQTVKAGNRIVFTSAATGIPTPTVQWQVSTNGGKMFKTIAGATQTTLAFMVTARQKGYQYRAVFKNALGKAFTTAATLTV